MLNASRSFSAGRVIILTLLALAFCTQVAHSQGEFRCRDDCQGEEQR